MAGGFSWAAMSGGLKESLEGVGIDKELGFNMLVSSAILIGVSYVAGKKFRTETDIEPSNEINFATAVEAIVLSVYNFSRTQLAGHARSFFWLTGGLFFFILLNNMIGTIPGFAPTTDKLNTTVTLAVVVFLAYNVVGISLHGPSYIKHFLGPVWWLSWLILPIELISHCVRPLSLALRLFGNMTGDHKVVAEFFKILAIGLPVIFMGMGVLVSFIQAFVFFLLTMIYIAGALEEAH